MAIEAVQYTKVNDDLEKQSQVHCFWPESCYPLRRAAPPLLSSLGLHSSIFIVWFFIIFLFTVEFISMICWNEIALNLPGLSKLKSY